MATMIFEKPTSPGEEEGIRELDQRACAWKAEVSLLVSG